MTKFRRYLRLPGGVDAEVDDELGYHVEMKVEQLMQQGWPEQRAREEAARQFGDAARVRREVRALVRNRARGERRASRIDELRQDVRFATRQLRVAPLFAFIAIITLGLGIGATTSIFSVVQAVLLRPLPYPDAERIVLIGESEDRGTKDARTTTSYANYLEWQARARSFESMGLFNGWLPTLTGLGVAERLQGSIVTAEIFRVFRLQPVLGRAMVAADNVPNGPRIVWISESFWRTRLGGAPNVIGRTITLNGTAREIVGVLPRFPSPGEELGSDVWIPNYPDPDDGRSARYLNVAARLKPGVTMGQARAEMAEITLQLQRAYPAEMEGTYAVVFPLRALVVGGGTRGPVLLLMLASALVLLIACANTSNLLIARGSYRAKEFAIRSALGTGRGRLVRQLLTESAVLAALGAAVGVLLATAGLRVLLVLAPESIRAQGVDINGVVLLFAVGSAVAAALGFGILPALRAAANDVQQTLRAATGVTAARSRRVRGALAVVQLSLALALLLGAALLVRSFARVLQIDAGIRADNLITMAMALPAARYTAEAMPRFYEEVIARARGTPGVSGAAVVSTVPFSGGWDRIAVDTGAARNLVPGAELPEGDRVIVSPSYFRVLGIRLSAGREFSTSDRFEAPRVAIVDEVFARKVMRHGSAIGVRLGVPGSDSMATIVGVVNNVPQDGLDVESRGQIYVSHLQYPWRWMSLVARTHGDPAAQAAPLRDVVRSVDPDQAVYDVRTMASLLSERSAPRRFVLALLAAFAGIALVLATVGLYGVIAYAIAQREREFGIRLALGAAPPSLVRLMMSEGLVLTAIGIPLGLLLTAAGARSLRALLFGVQPLDAASAAIATALLGATALLATWLPARRAARADPLQTMR